MTLPYIFLFLFLSFLLTVEIVFLIRLVWYALQGAPYVATDDTTLQDILNAVKIKKSEKIVDLGSGDGKIILALARQGYEAHGVEMSLPLALWTKWQIKKQGLEGKAFIHKRDMWKEDVSKYDVIIVYQITYIMKRMEKKLQKEIKPGSRVISNHFTFPHWKPKMRKGRLSIYTK